MVVVESNQWWSEKPPEGIPAQIQWKGQWQGPDWRQTDWVSFDDKNAQLLKQAARVAAVGLSVFLVGGQGSGKRRLSQWMLKLSGQSKLPWRTLRQGDLLGERHTAGNGEVLFVEELGDLDRALQHAIAERLHSGEVSASRLVIHSSVAPHRLLAEGRLDSELFLQLVPAQLELPSLSERRDEIGQLAALFLPDDRRLTAEAVEFLCAQAWPGNLSQLRAVLRRACVEEITNPVPGAAVKRAYQLTQELINQPQPSAATVLPVQSLENMERQYIDLALRSEQYNKTRAAKVLGIDRATLYRKAHRYGIALDVVATP